MDLKQYFKKLREAEATIAEPYALVCSLETSDGGKPGVISEVTRENAAKTIIEGRGALATEEEQTRYRAEQTAARHAAAKVEMAKRVRVAIVADPESQNQPQFQSKVPASKK